MVMPNLSSTAPPVNGGAGYPLAVWGCATYGSTDLRGVESVECELRPECAAMRAWSCALRPLVRDEVDNEVMSASLNGGEVHPHARDISSLWVCLSDKPVSQPVLACPPQRSESGIIDFSVDVGRSGLCVCPNTARHARG